MKINCMRIGLKLFVAGCGGGGGSGAAGGISARTPAPILFSSQITVLSEYKMHVSVDGCGGRLLRQIGNLIWRSMQVVIMPVSRDAIKNMS